MKLVATRDYLLALSGIEAWHDARAGRQNEDHIHGVCNYIFGIKVRLIADQDSR